MTEEQSIARTALLNAFYESFSDLVNSYLKAGEGLPELEKGIANMANVYSRDTSKIGETFINLWTQNANGGSTGFSVMLDAISHGPAKAVWLNGELVMEKEPSCHLCGGAGDIHSFDGEWRGECPYCVEED